MKKNIFLFFIFLSLLILFFRFAALPLRDVLGLQAKAGIKITSSPDGATVFLDGVEAGKTPYQDENLKVREYLVKLRAGDANWQGGVELTAGTMAVVNRELSFGIASSSGEVLLLEKGEGVGIVSSPDGADVEIDGKFYGKTPLFVKDLNSGEHNFLVSHSGYLKRNIKATLPKDFSLQISVDLAISESDITEASPLTVKSGPKLIIKQTPTGFLRVRDKPSVSGNEIGRVNTGETVALLEELSGWDRVRAGDGLEGYISASYTQKQP